MRCLFLMLILLQYSSATAVYRTESQQKQPLPGSTITINNVTGTLLEHYVLFQKDRDHFSKTDFLRYTENKIVNAYAKKNDPPHIKESKRKQCIQDILTNNFVFAFPYKLSSDGHPTSRYQQAIVFGTKNQEICKQLYLAHTAQELLSNSHDNQ